MRKTLLDHVIDSNSTSQRQLLGGVLFGFGCIVVTAVVCYFSYLNSSLELKAKVRIQELKTTDRILSCRQFVAAFNPEKIEQVCGPTPK